MCLKLLSNIQNHRKFVFKIIENLFYVRNARLIMGQIICLRFIRKNAFPT